MSGSTKLRLRVLYTINSSPQYILARSNTLLPVTPIAEPTPNKKDQPTRPKYATVPLRACLDTICRSSPELVQDNNRDFSVYVLDPLESNLAPAPMNISSSSAGVKSAQMLEKQPKEQPHGVAVGLGLMSWALHENDDTVVTGTRVKLSTGQEALEVIFALRETAAMQRASLSSTMKSWGIPWSGVSVDPIHSQVSEPPSTVDPNMLSLLAPPVGNAGSASSSYSDPQPKREHHSSSSPTATAVQVRNKTGQKRKISRPSTALTESDKLMYASETYIGPFKKKGRPKNPNNSGKPSNNSPVEESICTNPVPKLNSLVQNPGLQDVPHMTPNATLTSAPLRFLTSALPLPDTSQSTQGQASLLDLLTTLSNGQNARLLAALSAIDSSGTSQQHSSEPNPALVSAIGQLLLIAYDKQSSQSISIQSSSGSDAGHETATNTSQDEDVVILDKENIDPMAFRRREERESSEIKGNTRAMDLSSTLNVLGPRSDGQENSASGCMLKRKRTLSDFMDEKESERSKQKEKERSERREHRHSTQGRRSSGSNSIYDTDFRHYPRIISEALPMPGTNYYSRKPHDFRSSPPQLKVDACNVSSYLRRSTTLPCSGSKAPVSSPPKSSTDCPPRKRYVIPEWARTNTAMQPRLSAEAQRALVEAEERKQKEKEERRKSFGCKKSRHESRASRVQPKAKKLDPLSSPSAAKSDPPAPIAASDSYPVFATTDIATDIFSFSQSSMNQSSPPHSPPPSCPAKPTIPKTPPSKCASALFTPDNRDGLSTPLFTPTPRGRSGLLSGSVGSTVFTPRKRPPPSPSPSTIRNKPNKMSPIQAIVSWKRIDGTSRNGGASEEDEFRWGEPDGPPSSLPTASDAEDETPTSSTFEVETQKVESGFADGKGGQEYTVKQHWPGLPPSSPPPPSSPTLAPQEPDDDNIEPTDLPVPTSDIDESASSFSDVQEPTQNDDDDDDDETIKDEFDSFISSLTSDGSVPSDISIFNDLSTSIITVQKNGDNTLPVLDSSFDPILQNGVVDFDFTEFWESFKPMVQDFIDKAPSSDSGYPSVPRKVDHVKLAEDVHSLFSGCLM